MFNSVTNRLSQTSTTQHRTQTPQRHWLNTRHVTGHWQPNWLNLNSAHPFKKDMSIRREVWCICEACSCHWIWTVNVVMTGYCQSVDGRLLTHAVHVLLATWVSFRLLHCDDGDENGESDDGESGDGESGESEHGPHLWKFPHHWEFHHLLLLYRARVALPLRLLPASSCSSVWPWPLISLT